MSVDSFASRRAGAEQPTSRTPNPCGQWFTKFGAVVDVMRAGGQPDRTSGSYRKVKVAILDTGLEPDHRMAKTVFYKDFVTDAEEGMLDKTGHGTLSLDLILEAFPHDEAEFYVARVMATDHTNQSKPDDPLRMAEVIHPTKSH